MLVGSLPISFQGIGVRETAAVYLLSQHNINISVLLGNMLMISFASILVIAIMPLTIHFFPTAQKEYKEKKKTVFHNALKYIDENIGLISIPCIIFCFFETRVMMFNHSIPIAAGDLFAVFLLFVLIASFVNKKIHSSLKQLTIIMSILLSYFFLSFLYGWYASEFSSWAFNNRILGGLILFGYVQAGFLFFRLSNEKIKKTLLMVLGIVAIYSSLFIFLHLLYFFSGNVLFPDFLEKFYRMEFVGSGQHSVVTAVLLSLVMIVFLISFNKGILSQRIFISSVFILSVCVGLTHSLTGVIAIIAISLMWLLRDIKKYAVATIAVLFGVFLSFMLPIDFNANQNQESLVLNLGKSRQVYKENYFSNDLISEIKIWKENGQYSFHLLNQNWMMGSGLGGSLTQIEKKNTTNQFKYNTFSIYLADTGLIGVVLISYLFFWMFSLVKEKQQEKFFFWSAILCIGIFSIVHDISYQRFLWIWIGIFVSSTTKLDELGTITD